MTPFQIPRSIHVDVSHKRQGRSHVISILRMRNRHTYQNCYMFDGSPKSFYTLNWTIHQQHICEVPQWLKRQIFCIGLWHVTCHIRALSLWNFTLGLIDFYAVISKHSGHSNCRGIVKSTVPAECVKFNEHATVPRGYQVPPLEASELLPFSYTSKQKPTSWKIILSRIKGWEKELNSLPQLQLVNLCTLLVLQ